jgi:hypothetical protein
MHDGQKKNPGDYGANPRDSLRAIEVDRIEIEIPASQRAQVAKFLKDLAPSIGIR